MEENKLYDMCSAEFCELIDRSRINLKTQNLEYKKLAEKLHKILDKNENLQLIIETNKEFELNKEECKMLQKLYHIFMRMYDYEEREIFFLGARENYFYFKNLGLIKE